jgi:hypothetical protein
LVAVAAPLAAVLSSSDVFFFRQVLVIRDVNEPPQIWGGNFTVLENSPTNTFVSSLAYYDPDVEQALEFDIIDGDPFGAFIIGGVGAWLCAVAYNCVRWCAAVVVCVTIVLLVGATCASLSCPTAHSHSNITVNYPLLDYESQRFYNLTVAVFDPEFNATATVLVYLNDTNDPPRPVCGSLRDWEEGPGFDAVSGLGGLSGFSATVLTPTSDDEGQAQCKALCLDPCFGFTYFRSTYDVVEKRRYVPLWRVFEMEGRVCASPCGMRHVHGIVVCLQHVHPPHEHRGRVGRGVAVAVLSSVLGPASRRVRAFLRVRERHTVHSCRHASGRGRRGRRCDHHGGGW